MTSTYEIALGPNRPNQKHIGIALSHPPCERCIPIYPFRYGIVDKPLEPSVFPTLATQDYPALHSGKAYGLRVLRPGSYVYLCYFKDGRMWTQHYLVTEDIRFARIWWDRCDEIDATPGRQSVAEMHQARPYLQAPESHIAEQVYVMISDTLLSHRALWAIETNQDGLRDTLAVRLDPAAGPEQPHAFNAVLVGNATAELVPRGYSTPRHFEWSEIQFPNTAPDYNAIIRALYAGLYGRRDITPLAVALPDPIGIASELHYLVSSAVERKTKYAGQNAHALQSATLISNYFEAMHKQAAYSEEGADALIRQKKLVKYTDAMAFPAEYAERINAFDETIALAVNDAIDWVALMNPVKLLGKALSCFDTRVIPTARAYEQAVFQCIGGLVHTQRGTQMLAQLIDMPVDSSPYWLALANGSDLLLDRLRDSAGGLAKNAFQVLDAFMEEHAITPATNALIGLLQAVPAAKRADVLIPRLRHVMEIRANVTLVQYEMSLADLQRAAYEFQGHQSLEAARAQGWKVPTPKVTQFELNVRVPVYEWVKIGETSYHEIDSPPKDRPALPPPRAMELEGNPFMNAMKRMREPTGHLFVGLGGYLAVVGIKNALKELIATNQSLSAIFNVLGAGSALVGSAIEIGSSAVGIYAKTVGNTALANIARIISAERGVALFGSGAAALIAIADTVRALESFSSSNREQGLMFLGSALAGGALTFATWAGGIATAKALSGVGLAIVFGLSAAAWAVIALAAAVAIFAFAVGVDITKHGPAEIWLKHSAWGINYSRYTNTKELEAVYGLYYRPRIVAKWEQRSGYPVGTLRIHCWLPAIEGPPGEQFQTRLSFHMYDRTLHRIDGPIIYTGAYPLDYRQECLVTPLGFTAEECGWSIQMHQFAHVTLEYVYFPDPQHQPHLMLTPLCAPEPLIFKAGTWLIDPIESGMLQPLVGPL